MHAPSLMARLAAAKHRLHCMAALVAAQHGMSMGRAAIALAQRCSTIATTETILPKQAERGSLAQWNSSRSRDAAAPPPLVPVLLLLIEARAAAAGAAGLQRKRFLRAHGGSVARAAQWA